MGENAGHFALLVLDEFVGGRVEPHRDAELLGVVLHGLHDEGAARRGASHAARGHGARLRGVGALVAAVSEGTGFGEFETHGLPEPFDGFGTPFEHEAAKLRIGIVLVAALHGRFVVFGPVFEHVVDVVANARGLLVGRSGADDGAARERGGAARKGHLFDEEDLDALFGGGRGGRKTRAARPDHDNVGRDFFGGKRGGIHGLLVGHETLGLDARLLGRFAHGAQKRGRRHRGARNRVDAEVLLREDFVSHLFHGDAAHVGGVVRSLDLDLFNAVFRKGRDDRERAGVAAGGHLVCARFEGVGLGGERQAGEREKEGALAKESLNHGWVSSGLFCHND